jgi:hypothetical protein
MGFAPEKAAEFLAVLRLRASVFAPYWIIKTLKSINKGGLQFTLETSVLCVKLCQRTKTIISFKLRHREQIVYMCKFQIEFQPKYFYILFLFIHEGNQVANISQPNLWSLCHPVSLFLSLICLHTHTSYAMYKFPSWQHIGPGQYRAVDCPQLWYSHYFHRGRPWCLKEDMRTHLLPDASIRSSLPSMWNWKSKLWGTHSSWHLSYRQPYQDFSLSFLHRLCRMFKMRDCDRI